MCNMQSDKQKMINGQTGLKNASVNKNKNKEIKENKESVKEILFLNRGKNGNKFFILDGNRKVINCVIKKEFREKNLPCIGYRKISVKYFGCNRKEAEEVIHSIYSDLWRAETGPIEAISYISTICTDFIAKITKCIDSVKMLLNALNNQAFIPLLLDVLAMISSLTNPLPNFDGFFVRILRMYSMFLRGSHLFMPQGMEEALMLAAMLPMFPAPLVEIIKRMQLFTSRKLLDTPGLLMDFFGDLGKFISYILEKVPAPQFVKELVSKLFSIGHRFKYCNNIRKLISIWKTDKRSITEQEFSEEVLRVHTSITNDYDTFQFMLGAKKQLWDDFIRLRKAVLSYRHVNRQEPFCVIFQGPPGVKKSHIMNKVVQYDKESTYVHVVKATTDGKDFYDGYDNESYFIMDDVGQMGVSQWRTIINMVSTVKLPLDCAEASLKETKFFNSEVLLVTTNKFVNLHGLTKSDGIDNLEALWRRGHVLDFDGVRRAGADLDGLVEYKRFDVTTNKWVRTFIDGVMPPSFPTSMSANNEEKLIAWTSCIVSNHRKFFQSIKNDMEITKSQRDTIDAYKQAFNNDHQFFFQAQGVLGWCVDSFGDLKDIIKELIFEAYKTTTNYLTSLNISENITKNKNACGKFCEEFSTYINGIVMSVVLVGTLVSAYYLFFKKQAHVVHVDYTKDWRLALNVNHFRSQGKTQNTSTIVEAVQSRMIVVELHKNDGSQELLQAFISGLCVLLPYHVSTKGIISISGYLNFDQVDAKVKCFDHIKVEVAYQNKFADVCVLKLPSYYASPFKCGKKLLKPTRDESSKEVIRNGRAYFVNCYAKIPVFRIWVNHNDDIEYYSDSYSNIIKEEDRITYSISNNGLCGSLIVDQNLGILGMHVAGNGEKGVSIIFNDSVLLDLHRLFESNTSAYVDIPDIRLDRMNEQKEYSGIVLDKSYHIEVPKHTNFVESPLLPFVQSIEIPIKGPANLQACGAGTIHERAKKSFQLTSGYTKDELDFAKSCLEVWIPTFTDISDKEVIQGNKHLPRFNMKSVNGLGYEKGKNNYINILEGKVTPKFQAKLDDFKDKVKNRSLSLDDVILYETLKDELRAPGKEDKPRTFRISPLHLVYLMKKMFGDLAGQIIESKWENGIAIGMNPYTDWDQLYNILKPLLVFDGDVGEWDGKQPSELQDLVAEVLKNKYVGEDVELMSFFSEYLVRVSVAIMNKTVQTTHSVSSGYWLTALGNSILNRAHTSICYYRESIKLNRKPTVIEFLKIRDFVLGDDKLVGVPKELSFVNAITMRNYFESIGMTFTDGLKKRVSTEFMDISQVSFLKRKFVYHTVLKKVMCPLDLTSIYSSLGYYDKTKDYEVVMKGKVESAQRELWLHEINCDKLLLNASNAGILYSKLNESYLKHLFLEEGDLAWKLYLYESGKTDEYSISL